MGGVSKETSRKFVLHAKFQQRSGVLVLPTKHDLVVINGIALRHRFYIRQMGDLNKNVKTL